MYPTIRSSNVSKFLMCSPHQVAAGVVEDEGERGGQEDVRGQAAAPRLEDEGQNSTAHQVRVD